VKAERCGDAEWRVAVPTDWPGFAGHFPDDPLLPGAELIELASGCLHEAGLPHAVLRSARFRAAVRPGDALHMTLRSEAGRTRVLLQVGERRCAELHFDGGEAE